MTTVKELLTEARRTITDPDRWTTRVMARDVSMEAVDPYDPRAQRWCAIGSLMLASVTLAPTRAYEEAVDALLDGAGDRGLFETNDQLGHAAVLAMFDRAIEGAKA